MASIDLTEHALSVLQTTLSQEEFYDSRFFAGGSFGVRVSKTGRKVFFLIYSLNGRRKRMTLGTYPMMSLSEARSRAIEIRQMVDRGRDPAAENRTYSKVETFSQISALFLSSHVEARLSPKTQAEYRRMLHRDLLPCWGDRRISDIGRADIASLVEWIAQGRGSPVMADRLRALVSRIFNFALSRGFVSHNPARTLSPSATAERQGRILVLEELAGLWLALEREVDPVRSFFKFLVLTGQRPGTALSVRWGDFELDSWVLRSDSPRSKPFPARLPLSPQCQQLLGPLRAKSPPSEFVFASDRGKHLNHVRKAALRISKRMGLQRPWAPLDLRATVEHHLLGLGVEVEVIHYLLGRRTELKRLGKLPPTSELDLALRKCVNLWGREIARITERPPAPSPDSNVIPIFR